MAIALSEQNRLVERRLSFKERVSVGSTRNPYCPKIDILTVQALFSYPESTRPKTFCSFIYTAIVGGLASVD